MSKPRTAIPREVRARVLAMYDGRCAICGCKPNDLTVDHVMPPALGGTDDEDNLQPACELCNRRKGDSHPGNRVGRWQQIAETVWALPDSTGCTRLEFTQGGGRRMVPEPILSGKGALLTERDILDAATIKPPRPPRYQSRYLTSVPDMTESA